MLQLPHLFLRAVDVGGQAHVVLKMVEIVIGHYFYSYFLPIFNPTSLHIPYPTFMFIFVMFLSLCLHAHNRQQEHNSIGTTDH